MSILLKRVLSLAIMVAFSVVAFAQSGTSKSTTDSSEFDPYWSAMIQAGIGHTVGESAYMDLISPAAAISASYRFTPVFGLRATFSGWESKGYTSFYDEVYKFNFIQGSLNATIDVMNIFAGYKSDRLVNPYILAGIGVNYAFNNDEAEVYFANVADNELCYLWTDSKTFFVGRLGIGVDFAVTERLLIGVEGNMNILSDKFNSKNGDNPDWQYNMLVGLTYRFGSKKSSTPAPAPAPKPAPAPAKKAEPAPAPAPKPAPAPVVEANSDLDKPYSINFALDSAEITPEIESEIDKVVALMNKYPKVHAEATGYADVQTGTPTYNKTLSRNRVENVKATLVKKGIAKDRIEVYYVGDTVQPYSENDLNRTVIIVLKE